MPRYPHPGPRTAWKHAADIPRRQRGLFLARTNRNNQPCEHGHFGCSDREHGPCAGELFAQMRAEHQAADPHCTCADCLN